MDRAIRIGTRESRLARWQAEFVAGLLNKNGIDTELVLIGSEGDIDLVTPIYEMGIQGVFTKSLDSALLNHRIDLAVHSLKDVPTLLPQGLDMVSVPQREDPRDILVSHSAFPESGQSADYCVASGSLRRQAQWLEHFPNDKVVPLRGNVQTRLDKLYGRQFDAAVFAYAGLRRLGIEPEHFKVLDWMLPAPAQGALGLVCRSDDELAVSIARDINQHDAYICTFAERQFLSVMNAGCTMPIAALCTIDNGLLNMKAKILTIDGSKKASTQLTRPIHEYKEIGHECAMQLLSSGGDEIRATFTTKSC